MATFSAAPVWVNIIDGRGTKCWHNNVTGQVVYSDPGRVGLAVRLNPNTDRLVEIKPVPPESVWEEYTDPITNRKYWYNRITKKSTWQDPHAKTKTQPPKKQPEPPKIKIREQDQWAKINDPKKGKGWYNMDTKDFQVERPDCLIKYR